MTLAGDDWQPEGVAVCSAPRGLAFPRFCLACLAYLALPLHYVASAGLALPCLALLTGNNSGAGYTGRFFLDSGQGGQKQGLSITTSSRYCLDFARKNPLP